MVLLQQVYNFGAVFALYYSLRAASEKHGKE